MIKGTVWKLHLHDPEGVILRDGGGGRAATCSISVVHQEELVFFLSN